MRRAKSYNINLSQTLEQRLVELVRESRGHWCRHLKWAAKTFSPQFEIEGVIVVMSTPEIAGVPCGALGDKIASLQHRREEIIAVLDLLFTGI